MIDKVIDRLKTGRVKAVIPFGDQSKPSNKTPYIVVKDEPVPRLGILRWRIIAHFPPGQVMALREYVRKDLYQLLNNYRFSTKDDNSNLVIMQASQFGGGSSIVNGVNELGTLTIENDDNTISQERVFYTPDLF